MKAAIGLCPYKKVCQFIGSGLHSGIPRSSGGLSEAKKGKIARVEQVSHWIAVIL